MENKLVIGVIIGTIALIGGGVWLAGTMKQPDIVVSQDAIAEVEETSHDWGAIPLNGGKVNQSFTIKNTGTVPLQLHDILTSCMCTTAQVMINGQSSPEFGMHQKSAWVGEVPPGQEAQLTVTFDPAYHGPSGVGDITRQVKVETNDPNHPQLTFNLAAQVTN